MGDSIATSFAANLASKLVESLVAPIGRHFGFVLCFKSYVEDLENIVNELEIAQQMVQPAVQAAENNGRLIFDYIEEWLNSVRVETQKAHNLLERGRSAENACFRGWLPNPVLRHPIGRKARRITKVIRGLIDKSQNFDLGNVSHERPPIGVVTFPIFPARSVDAEEDDLKSRASIKKKLLKALADDEVRVVGVWGAPGLGKSKLLDNIEKRVRMDQKPFDLVDWKPFDLVAMVKLSRNQDIRIIQDGIADAVGLHQINEKTLDARACRIRERLERGPQKNILIIIDNLWEKLELKDVGIPCGDYNKVRGCKLLLSSRNRSILLDDMGCDPLSLFQLKGLEHDEARILFERIVGEKVNSPEFETWVDGVVKNCGGLPLLIVPLAKKLKHRDLPAWRDASTNRDLSTIESQVESSYRDLKDERIRLLFLLCALGSGTISVRISLFFCMGLGLLKNFSKTIKNARDVLFGDLQTLQDSSLLLKSQNTELFRMHDIIVDVAISLRDKFMDMNWRALVWRKGDHGYKESSKDDLKNCTAISFCHVGMDEFPEKLDCPNLRILLLFQGKQSLKISESFFDSTKMLQILVIIGLSFTSLPSSIAFLENLKTLSLDYCNLKDVTVLGKLIKLQFLSLRRSIIARLPKEIGELTELRFLDLRMCFWLKVIDPGVLERLINLEELYIGSFDQWETKDESPRSNASLIELKNMKKLRTLYISIPRWTDLSSDLPFGNLSEHKIGIGGILDWRVGDRESNILKLKLDSGDLLQEVWMQRCLQLTHDLHLEGSQDGEDSVHKLCTEGFEQLKYLCVQNNSTFKCIVDSTRCPAFTKLESLSLQNLNGWENICRGVLAPESFSKLNTVKVENCGEIRHLFSSSMMRIFLQLEEIQISKCRLMEQIVADTEIDEDGDKIDDDPNLKSCKLRRLTLQNLPKMTSFYKTMDHRFVFFNAQQASFPRLESLTLAELPKLEEIWNSQYPSEVGNLKFLEVKGCTSLSSIIPSNLLIRLQNLEAITIEKCQLIREVFNLEDFSENVGIMGQLTRLTLNGLPRLEHIWNKNPRGALCFQNLRALRVQNCENLRFLFSAFMAKALVQITEIEVASCVLMEEIMDMQEEELEEVPTTDTLEFPLLNSLSLLKLSNLKAFSHGKYYIHCPSLTKLTISSCPKMMTFASSEGRQQSATSDTDLQQAFDSINSGLSLPSFSTKRAKTLQQIKEIEIASCKQLEEIIDVQEEELEEVASINTLEFPLLTSLSLEELPNLKTFSYGTCRIHYPSLTRLMIVGCPKMMTFSTSKGRQQSITIDTGSQQVLGDVNSTMSLPTLFDQNVLFPSLEQLTLVSCGLMKIWHNELCEESFCKLASITVRDCENLSHIFPSTLIERFQNLKMIEVVKCTSLEAFVQHVAVNSKKRQKRLVSLHFEEVKLWDLPRLNAFVTSSTTATFRLPSLNKVSLRRCHGLRYLFTNDTSKSLGKLEKLDISYCNNMQEVVVTEEGEEQKLKAVKFSHLHELKLCYLKRLISFSSGSCAYEFPSLRNLSILGCTGLKAFMPRLPMPRVGTLNDGSAGYEESPHSLFDKKVVFPKLEELRLTGIQSRGLWENNMPDESICQLKILEVKQCPDLLNVIPSVMGKRLLHYMESLTVEECPRLRNLFTVSMAKSLVQLQCLVLGGCGEMEYIVAKEEEKSEEIADIIVIPQLVTLHLHKMIKLISFCHRKHISKWPSLKKFIVEDCKAVKVILEDPNFRRLEGNVPTQQPLLLVEKVEFPNMESMKISRMDNMEKIWPSELASNAFTKLKTLMVEYCEKLSSLFSSHAILTRFQNLEEIVMTDCGSLEVVFHNEEVNFGEACSTRSTFELRKVVLSRLQKMKHVCSGAPCGTLTFERLQCLEVENCESLKSLFPASIAKSMTQLEKLRIYDCGVEEIIMDEDGVEMREGDLFFPQLTDLRLLELPKWRSFYRNIYTSTWPLLKQLRVRHCGKMRPFSFTCEFQSYQGTTTSTNLCSFLLKRSFPAWRDRR